MRVALTGVLDVPEDSDLDVLHSWFEETLDDVQDATTVSVTYGQMGYEFRVVGTTRGKPDQSWEAKVVAETAEDAAAAAVAEDDTRAVADVQPTGVPTAPPPPMTAPDAPATS